MTEEEGHRCCVVQLTRGIARTHALLHSCTCTQTHTQAHAHPNARGSALQERKLLSKKKASKKVREKKAKESFGQSDFQKNNRVDPTSVPISLKCLAS